MKKLMFGLTLCLILVSCNKEEKGAIDYLKNLIKTPDSFKKISCEATIENEIFYYDTIYHIIAIEGEKLSSTDGYLSATSVSYDSIKIFHRPLFAHTNYNIVFEAANEYGTMIREKATIYYYNETYTHNVSELMGEIELHEEKYLEGTIPYNRPYGCPIEIGKWYGFYAINDWWQYYTEDNLFINSLR